MIEDLRYAFRQLRKQPGFAAVSVLTLALGIGVNANVFGIISAFFFQPLSVPHHERLAFIVQKSDIWSMPHGLSFPDYLDYREGSTSLSDLVAYMPTPVHLSAAGQAAERTWIELVTPNYFALAGVEPGLGQLLRPGEGEAKGAAPVLVLSHRYWQRRFGGDPSVVGRSVTLNGRAFTVVGVAPASFSGLAWAMAVSGWAPSGAAPTLMSGGDGLLTHRGAEAWRVMGRLRPGVTLAEARAQVEVVAKRLAETYADTHKGARVLVIPESRARPDPTFSELLPLLALVFGGMVGLVLFIACANVANLMFSRTLGRQRELAVRAALGAGRLRLIRLQVVESVLLALVAGVFGLLLATGLGWFLASFTPTGDVPVNTEHPWDWRGFVFTALVSLAAGIGTGLWPALNASGAALSETLKEGGGGRGASSRHPFRNLLVVGQVTLSLVVLAASALFLRSLRNAGQVALGFRPDHLLMMSIDLGLQQYEEPRAQQFLRELVEGTRALPGVRAATLAVHVPFDYGIQLTEIGSDGDVAGSKDGFVAAAFSVVRHGYLEMVGASLLRGRDLAESDGRDAPRVAVVNETLARMLWPGQDPLGHRFRFGRDGDWTEVVGLVADGKYVMLAEDARPYFYLPLAQQYRSPVTLLVRTATQPTALVKPVQDVLGRLDPDLPVFNIRSMEAHLRGSAFGLMPLRSGAALAGFQGLLALALAVMGLYAVVSYAVGRRTQEIGVRIALGARTRDVLRLVLREGMLLTAVGVGLGLVGAAGVAVLLSHVLPGLATVDVGALVLVTLLLVAITALACYLPARRATRVDPATALRYE